MIKTILVAGGDLRSVYLAEALASALKDTAVYAVGFDRNVVPFERVTLLDSLRELPNRADMLVLPLPVSPDGVFVTAPFFRQSLPLDNLPSVLQAKGYVFGGKFSFMAKEPFIHDGLRVIDYFDREELAVLNAIPTAEGALQIAMEEMPITVHGSKVLILGMGRIGKVLVKLLNALGAKVTLGARKYQDLVWGEIYGCLPVHISELEECGDLGAFDLVINTIPAVVLDESLLPQLKSSALVVDLASKPGGVDFDTASRLGIKTVWALSLPGKTAPVSAGQMIAKTILNILKEKHE